MAPLVASLFHYISLAITTVVLLYAGHKERRGPAVNSHIIIQLLVKCSICVWRLSFAAVFKAYSQDCQQEVHLSSIFVSFASDASQFEQLQKR